MMLTEPVAGKNFFGRGEILSLLDKRIKAMREGYRQNVAITGQSLAGKSSLLQHFLYTSLDDSFLPIYVEVLREDFPSFANKFIATLLYNSLKTREEPGENTIEGLIQKAEKFFPKTAQAIKGVLAEIDRGQLDDAYANLLGLTSVVKEEASKPCVVILDEFDNISHFRVKNPFLNFGKVIMIQKDTMYIISSSRNAAIKKILQEKLSLLFGNFEVVEVRGFDTKTAADFIQKKTAPLAIEELAQRFLIYFTDGNPFYIEHIAQRSRDVARERSQASVGIDALEEAILDLVYGSSGTIHQYLSNLLLDLLETKTRESLIAVLGSISEGHMKQRDLVKDLKRGYGDVSKSISRLMEAGLMSKLGVFSIISDPMLAFWLRHVHLKKQRMLVNYIIDKARVYRDDIHAYIEDFARESGKTRLERVYELFHLFSNDLVDMEGKQVILPQCDKVEIKSFDDVAPYIVASSKETRWVCQIFDAPLGEPQIAEFIRSIKSLDYKVTRKILVPFRGMEENARLLAKELRILIWDPETINLLLRLYDRKGIVNT